MRRSFGWTRQLAIMALVAGIAVVGGLGFGTEQARAAWFTDCFDDPPGGYVICSTGTNIVPSSVVRTYHNPKYCHLVYKVVTSVIAGPGCWGPGDYAVRGIDLSGTGFAGHIVRHQVDNQGSGSTNARYEGGY